MDRRTILDAVAEVLADAPEPLGAKEIYDEIQSRGLYAFKAKDPVNVVAAAIRAHVRAVSSGKVAARVRPSGAGFVAAT